MGDAGIGKSRLTRAVIDTLSAEPLYRLLFQCSPHHGSSILRPVLQRLARVANLELAEPVEHALDKLERVLTTGTADVPRAASLIAPLLGLDGEARYGKLNLSPAQHRARALEVLVDQLAGIARRRPLLLILEDVHWTDATTLELLDLAIDRLSALPVLVLLTARPAFGPPLRRASGGELAHAGPASPAGRAGDRAIR